MRKIVFITTHQWNSNRQGGFHKFAEFCADSNIQTVFFSFPRPYYGKFMKTEQMNKKTINLLSKGISCSTAKGSPLINVTYPTLRLPDSIGKFLPAKLMIRLASSGLKSFKSFSKKFLSSADTFVFESCEGIYLLPEIKKLFPEAKIIYRPSDPLVFDNVPERLKKAEQKILKNADLNLIVNEEGINSYKKEIPDFDTTVKYKMLSNGIDIDSYTKKYPVPELLQKKNTVLYVGAWEVCWDLLFKASTETPDFNYVVVCPNFPSPEIRKRVESISNLFYVPGIKPAEVPAWITNCSVVMVPYQTDFYKDRPLGITAKYYQAMAAGKPIVAYSDTPKLQEAGVYATYSFEDFINSVKTAMNCPKADYTFNLSDRSWDKICTTFIESIEEC